MPLHRDALRCQLRRPPDLCRLLSMLRTRLQIPYPSVILLCLCRLRSNPHCLQEAASRERTMEQGAFVRTEMREKTKGSSSLGFIFQGPHQGHPALCSAPLLLLTSRAGLPARGQPEAGIVSTLPSTSRGRWQLC
jgi:hypothetical protein